MKEGYNDPAEVEDIVERYYHNPSPENGEEVLRVFENLINCYLRYLKRGEKSYTKSVRTLGRMLSQEWVVSSLEEYTESDILNELRLCILQAAKEKGHVANIFPYYVRTMIRKLTSDQMVYNTESDALIEERDTPVSANYSVDPAALTLFLSKCTFLNDEERWLIQQEVEGWTHEEIRRRHTEKFQEDLSSRGKSTGLSRRRISEKLLRARGKLQEELRDEYNL